MQQLSCVNQMVSSFRSPQSGDQGSRPRSPVLRVADIQEQQPRDQEPGAKTQAFRDHPGRGLKCQDGHACPRESCKPHPRRAAQSQPALSKGLLPSPTTIQLPPGSWPHVSRCLVQYTKPTKAERNERIVWGYC